MKKFLYLIAFLLALFLVEWSGHRLTATSVRDWYLLLDKPKWNPPNWIFGPLWTALYISIAISGWLIFIKVNPSSQKKIALAIYGLQLFCNLLWSYCFFFLKSPGFALLDILILLSLVGMNIVAFAKIYRPAAFILIPYLIWILYATVLNFAIWSLNR